MNINKLMQQMQAMQQNISKAQSELASKIYEGTAGGGLIKIAMDGKGSINKLSIDPSLVNKDEVDVLEDLIIAAYNDVKKKLEEATSSSMSGALGGMQLPPGMKFPF